MIFLGLKFRIVIHGIGLCRFRSLLRKVGPFNNEYPSFCVLILLHSMDFFKDSNGGSISWKRKYLQFFNGFYNFIFTHKKYYLERKLNFYHQTGLFSIQAEGSKTRMYIITKLVSLFYLYMPMVLYLCMNQNSKPYFPLTTASIHF